MAASADHIKALVKSHGSGDDEAFYSIALQVAAKAARQGHHRFAADVKRLVESARGPSFSVFGNFSRGRSGCALRRLDFCGCSAGGSPAG